MKTKLIFVLLISLFIVTNSALATWKWHDGRVWIDPREEIPFGPKAQVIVLSSMALQVMGTQVIHKYSGLSHTWSEVTMFTAGLTFGIAKEYWYDAYREGFSWIDVTAQFVGQSTALVFFVRENKIEIEPTQEGLTLKVRF